MQGIHALTEHRELMFSLAARHEELLKLIGNRSVQYLDIPVHNNIGDLLIYLGTLEFLRRNEVEVSMTAAFFNHSHKRDDSVILLHGGGNVGDLYAKHQVFREKIIATHSDNRIIILPQTIHFEAPENLQRAADVMSRHSDLYICARDSLSLQAAEQLGPHALLMPDMAHQLYPLVSPVDFTSGSTLHVRRIDRESLSESLGFRDGDEETDWGTIVGERRSKKARRVTRLFDTARKFGLNRIAADRFIVWWERTAGTWVGDAAELFSRHEMIATDRLHGHILACLMDKRNTVLDNNYGKNSSYVECWTKKSQLVTTAFRTSAAGQ